MSHKKDDSTADKVDAWMPLWIGAYLADTMHLSRDSHGGYLLLLFAYWRNKGPLPDDDVDLSGITKATPSEWRKLRPRLAKFFTIGGGFWAHGRADKELASAGVRKSNAVSKAKAAAKARWGDTSEESLQESLDESSEESSDDSLKECLEHAPSIPQALPEHCPTPSPIKEKEAIASSSTAAPSTDAESDDAESEDAGDPDDDVDPDAAEADPLMPPCPHRKLIALWGQRLPSLVQPKPELWDGAKAKNLRARWRWLLTAKRQSGERYAETEAQALAWFGRMFDYIGDSDHLMGRNGRGWECTLDWVAGSTNFAKIVNGNYQNRKTA